jgi:hypothetical protein
MNIVNKCEGSSLQGFDSGPESQNRYYNADAVVEISENHYAHAQHEERRPAV